MKVLVIGNTGFIGRPLAEVLIQEGHDVRGMDVRLPADKTGYPCVAGDITKIDDIRRAAAGTELIINLAAEHRDFGISRDRYFGVNDIGTLNVVRTATELGIERVFFFSSVAVYGPGTDVNEATAVNPAVPYGESKAAGEQRMRAWVAENPRHQAIILRPTVVFGPRNFGNMYNLIRTIVTRRFVMVGPGQHVKSVAYVGNVVAATLFLVRQMRPGLAIYNYSDYPQMTTRELVHRINAALGRSAPRMRLPLAPVLLAAQAVDVVGRWTGYDFPITANRIRKLNMSTAILSDDIRALGFRQTTPIDEAIRLTVAWYQEYRRAGQD